MTSDIERTREKVGIERLDVIERKELFGLFIDHGGKIVGERKKKTQGQLIRYKRQEMSKKSIGKKKGSQKAKQPAIKHFEADAADKRRIKIFQANKNVKLIDLIIIQMKGLTNKVFRFGGRKFTRSFVTTFEEQIRWYYEELYVTLNSILKEEDPVIDEIKRMSKGTNSIFFEVLTRLNALYDEREFLTVAEAVSRKTIPGEIYMKVFKQFFKKIYMLAQFKNICKMYMEIAVEIKGRNNKISPDIVMSVKNQLEKDIEVLLGDFLTRFHIVLCRMDRLYHPLFSRDLESFLGVNEKDRIGYLTRMEKKKRIEEVKTRREAIRKMREGVVEEVEEITLPEYVERGLPLVKNAIANYEIKHRYDLDSPLRILEKSDRMYNTVILFEIFNSEYSFILSTGKIFFNIDYREQRRINIKEDLNHSYLFLSEAWEEVKDYIKIVKEIKDVNDNSRINQHQRFVMIEILKKKRSTSRRNTTQKIVSVMKTIENILTDIILDYDSEKRLLQNPDEILNFDKNIDGEKSVNGKKVIEGITEAFLFSATFPVIIDPHELALYDVSFDTDIDRSDTFELPDLKASVN